MSIARGPRATGAAASRAYRGGPAPVVPVVMTALALVVVVTPGCQRDADERRERADVLHLALPIAHGVTPGAGSDYSFGLAVAPDGRDVAFSGVRAGVTQLFLQRLTTGETLALPGTEGGVQPFWAPDGQRVGFFAANRLKTVAPETGEIDDLADAPSPRGAVWLPGGDLLFAPHDRDGLYRRALDGDIEPFTRLEKQSGETSHRLPALLGDRHVLFYVRAQQATREGLWVAALDNPARRARLVGSGAGGMAAGDWLLYATDDVLVASRVEGLETDLPRLSGRAVVLGMPVGRGPQNQVFASAAADILVYGAPQPALRELAWVDRQGTRGGALAAPSEAWDLRIDPRGNSVAVTEVDPQLGTLDVRIYDGGRPVPRRISQSIGADEGVVWSPDGTRLAWVAGRRAVTVRGALGELPEDTRWRADGVVRVWDWSPGGDLVLSVTHPDTRDDLWLLPVRDGEPRPYARSPFNEVQGAVSPDGRWLAYASDESGHFEIYVDSFPVPGRRGRLTSGGGTEPRWHRGVAPGTDRTVAGMGAPLLYFRRGDEIHQLSVSLSNGRPEARSSTQLFAADGELRAYDVAPGGQRFLINLPTAGTRSTLLTVLVNWQSLVADR